MIKETEQESCDGSKSGLQNHAQKVEEKIPKLFNTDSEKKKIDSDLDNLMESTQNFSDNAKKDNKELRKLSFTNFVKNFEKENEDFFSPKSQKDLIHTIKTFYNVHNSLQHQFYQMHKTCRELDLIQNKIMGKEINIFKAIQNHDIECVKYLVENNYYDLNHRNEDNICIPTYCLMCGSKDIYDYILSQNPIMEFREIETKPFTNNTFIFNACKDGMLEWVQWIIEKEHIDKNTNISLGDRPIHIAAQKGHLPIVQYLIIKQNVDKDIKGRDGKTPLIYACENGSLPVANYLISIGANVEARDNLGNYVIHYAVFGNLFPILQYLIEKMHINVNIPGRDNKTPLHIATELLNMDLMSYLVMQNADKEAKDKNGQTPETIYYYSEK